MVLALTEFQVRGGSNFGLYEHIVAQELRGSHWLVGSPGVSKGGVALLLSTSVAPGTTPPAMVTHLPARLIEVQLRLSLAMPGLTSVVCFYGSNIRSERLSFLPSLQPLLSKPCLIMGDFNAITLDSDTTISHMTSLKWSWLQELESSQKLIDLNRIAHKGRPPHTRVRGYGGSSSYLDRIYASRTLCPFLEVRKGSTFSVPKSGSPLTDSGMWSDHDLVYVELQPWSIQTDPTPTCAGWTKKHVHRFQTLMRQWQHQIVEEPIKQYVSLREHMRWAFLQVQLSLARPRRPTGQSWSEYVRSLLRLARRNPKCFLGGSKVTTFLHPSGPGSPCLPLQCCD